MKNIIVTVKLQGVDTLLPFQIPGDVKIAALTAPILRTIKHHYPMHSGKIIEKIELPVQTNAT